jgi:hypothetical protein
MDQLSVLKISKTGESAMKKIKDNLTILEEKNIN